MDKETVDLMAEYAEYLNRHDFAYDGTPVLTLEEYKYWVQRWQTDYRAAWERLKHDARLGTSPVDSPHWGTIMEVERALCL